MKKSLIVLAIAGVFAAPAAMAADVTIYGAANASFDMTKNGATGATASTSANKVSSNESHIGFKGAEDVGGGLAVAWQVESAVALDNGTTGLASRDSFVGVAGGFGTALLGKHDTPYKMATRGLDVFADTIADNRNLMGLDTVGVRHDIRLGNVLAYVSPKIADSVTVVGAYVTGGESPTGAAGEIKGSAVSLAALYGAGPVNASVAYQTVTVGTGANGSLGNTALGLPGAAVNAKATAMKVGGGFAQDMFAVNAVIERTSLTLVGGSAVTNTNVYVGGKFNLGASDAIKAAVTSHGNSSTGGSTDGATQIAVGFDHNLSKNSTVYALYTKVTNKTTGAQGLGMSADGEISGAQAGAGSKSSPSALSIGVKHSF